MDANHKTFLNDLLNAPGPSGYEEPVQAVVREWVSEFADSVETDYHGNVIVGVNPEGSPRIMLDGHSDQIGLLVNHIDDDGYLRVIPVGGWDVQMLIGQKLQVWTESGPVNGVIARKAIHLLTPDERKTVPEIKHLWIDIGASSGDEAKECVAIGDPVTFELGMRELKNDLIAGAAMDDRVGVWVVMAALKLVKEANPKAAVFAVAAVAEEIGLRGAKTAAFSIDPQVGIAVDVTHATDCPTIDKNEHGDIKIGGGPAVVRGANVNPVVFKQLKSISAEKNIPIQINALARGAGNDGNVIQVNRGGVATGLVTIPNRYMHSPVEVVSESDLENAAKLIAEFCLNIDEETDFTP
ncbi:MAG: M42 family metallopeptidase [Planctomycetaceae bacterium]